MDHRMGSVVVEDMFELESIVGASKQYCIYW